MLRPSDDGLIDKAVQWYRPGSMSTVPGFREVVGRLPCRRFDSSRFDTVGSQAVLLITPWR